MSTRGIFQNEIFKFSTFINTASVVATTPVIVLGGGRQARLCVNSVPGTISDQTEKVNLLPTDCYHNYFLF